MSQMDSIARAVHDALIKNRFVQVEVSARHVHLCAADLETLFGPGAALTPKRDLSQPGQFLSEERVSIVGPKGRKDHIAVLGPIRPDTQVELSVSDCVALGVKAPVRESGDVRGSGGITLEGPRGSVTIPQGVIVAKGHIHVTPETAAAWGVSDKQRVCVEILTDRPVLYPDVLIRVSDRFRNRMHIDFDEANAAAVNGFTLGRIQAPQP